MWFLFEVIEPHLLTSGGIHSRSKKWVRGLPPRQLALADLILV